MAIAPVKENTLWRLVVVGGHTRSIGKTQLVCDVIRAFPRTQWVAGKVTQYGHGVCAQNGENCDCAPTEHVCALEWEARADTGTDSARFLAAGAKRSFWLRTKQGYLAEGLPLLREALGEIGTKKVENEIPQGLKPGVGQTVMSELKLRPPKTEEREERKNLAVIIESNSLMQFVKPSLYFAVIDPVKDDFKESAQMVLDRADALVMRGEVAGDAPPAPLWMRLPAQLMKEKPSVLQREGENLPEPLWVLVHRILEEPPGVAI
ncbi:MAG: hypothetical protein WBL63_23285 [Candidatus Acidiferrum sp.]